MLAKPCFHPERPDASQFKAITHLLVILPPASTLPRDCPARTTLLKILSRRNKTYASLRDTPLAASLADQGMVAWCILDEQRSVFEQQTLLRQACHLLLDDEPSRMDIILVGEPDFCQATSSQAVYVALANGTPLPCLKGTPARHPLQSLFIWGSAPPTQATILAEANLLARTLTVLPSNILTPGAYRERLRELATDLEWTICEYDCEQLQNMGAGAFLAVAAGSSRGDAAIVHLSYSPPTAVSRVALVGKGICFDTGGHNLKPAKSMSGMQEDMSGSAVVLGILLAATRLQLPLQIDAWLALACNDISPHAYRQGDVVKTLNGTTVEVVHTDAEGRLVLADTISLALRETPEPQLLIDFATLTGSMITALGTRYAGVFASSDSLVSLAKKAGSEAGERVCCFPMDDDYEDELESIMADIKQCSPGPEADHILAARFLKRFVEKTPWIHLDLSAAHCTGGLGAIPTPQTGFGVVWGVQFLRAWCTESNLPGLSPCQSFLNTAEN